MEVVKALIEKGADVNAKDQVRCWVDCFVGLNGDTLSVQQQDSAAGADIQSHQLAFLFDGAKAMHCSWGTITMHNLAV
jgi:hypothetical protein